MYEQMKNKYTYEFYVCSRSRRDPRSETWIRLLADPSFLKFSIQ